MITLAIGVLVGGILVAVTLHGYYRNARIEEDRRLEEYMRRLGSVMTGGEEIETRMDLEDCESSGGMKI